MLQRWRRVCSTFLDATCQSCVSSGLQAEARSILLALCMFRISGVPALSVDDPQNEALNKLTIPAGLLRLPGLFTFVASTSASSGTARAQMSLGVGKVWTAMAPETPRQLRKSSIFACSISRCQCT